MPIINQGGAEFILTPNEAKLKEAFLRQMQLNYSLIDSNGTTMKVIFNTKEMTDLKVLLFKIDKVQKKTTALDLDKNINQKERADLQGFYSNILNSYVKRKNILIAQTAVIDPIIITPNNQPTSNN